MLIQTKFASRSDKNSAYVGYGYPQMVSLYTGTKAGQYLPLCQNLNLRRQTY